MDSNTRLNPVRVVSAVFVCLIGLVLLIASGSLVESLDAKQVMVIQYPSGKMACQTQPGYYMQWFGTAAHYDKQDTYSFTGKEGIPVQFADGAHGTIEGTLAWQMPISCDQILKLHTVTGSQAAVETRFLRPVVAKSVYFAGPLMTSKESYSERKGELLADIEDQITNGVYRTSIITKKEPDPITGTDKTVSQVVRTPDPRGGFARQDSSPLTEYGIRTYNLAVQRVAYDGAVEAQIQEQQKLVMSVQTAQAQSRQAEQRALTTEKEGQANAAKAKWEQEVIKAKMVTEAESRLAVERTNNEIAEQYRQAMLKKADADSTYRKRVMEADGALQQRLDAQIKIATVMADAIKNHQGSWTPNVVMGSGGANGGASGAMDLINLMTIQAAKQVGLTEKQKN